ncbi:MAG: hypothetical protein HGA85_06070 [Nanoarchaeota archaeon]|nr:hypothetical protein [Nanoarchaeota archaeon]
METPDKETASEGPSAGEIDTEKSPLKKAYLIAIALLLVFLFISGMVGQHIFLILEGKVVSRTVQDNIVVMGNVTIAFSNGTMNTLKRLYLDNQEKEFKLCLTGERAGSLVNVTSIYQPKTYSRTPISVEAQICSGETVIELHTHPLLHCIFSDQDLRSFAIIKKRNPDVLMGLMCDRDRFSFVS